MKVLTLTHKGSERKCKLCHENYTRCVCKLTPTIVLDTILEECPDGNYYNLHIDLDELIECAQHTAKDVPANTTVYPVEGVKSKYADLVCHFIAVYLEKHARATASENPTKINDATEAFLIASTLVSVWASAHEEMTYTSQEARVIRSYLDHVPLDDFLANVSEVFRELMCLVKDPNLDRFDKTKLGVPLYDATYKVTHPYETLVIYCLDEATKAHPQMRLHFGQMFHQLYELQGTTFYDVWSALDIAKMLTSKFRIKPKYFNPLLYDYDTAKVIDTTMRLLNAMHGTGPRPTIMQVAELEALVLMHQLY